MRRSPADRILDLEDTLDASLSRTHGFLSAQPPEASFPDSHRAWDLIVEKLPTLIRNY